MRRNYRKLAIVTAGPSHKKSWPKRKESYDCVIAVNAACLTVDAEFFAVMDDLMMEQLEAAGRKPKVGYITRPTQAVPERGRWDDPWRMIYPATAKRRGSRWSFVGALEAAPYLAPKCKRVDVYGFDASYAKNRADRELPHIAEQWTEKFQRIGERGPQSVPKALLSVGKPKD